jgi:hypothetical protein
LLLQWIIGGLVVVVYGADRFKYPQPMRATTTFWRYWSAWGGYIIAMVGLFLLLGGAITGLDPGALMTFLGAGAPPLDAKTGTLPAPLLAALVLTSLLPHFPVLGKIDDAVKEWFQRVGNMPFEVRELSAHLQAASYEPPAEALDQLLPIFRSFGVDPAWLTAPADSIKRRWARSVALYAEIQQWEVARSYARYMEENSAVMVSLRAKLTALAENLDGRGLDALVHDSESPLVARMGRQIETDLSVLERALYDFVSGGVLSGGRLYPQRRATLTQLGFSGLPATRGALTANDVVLVVGLVFLTMLFLPLMMSRFFDPTPLRRHLSMMVLVPIIYAIAIVAAIYPKSVWPFAAAQPGGPRPVAAYAFSGAIAVVAAFAVSLLFRFAFNSPGNVFQALATPGAFARAWGDSIQRWPWLLMPFFTTVAIAWAADDHPPNTDSEPGWLRWVEAAALAVIFAGLQWTVLQLLLADMLPPDSDRLSHALPRMLVTASVIGACIGALVPRLYRSRCRLTPTAAIGLPVHQTA